LRTRDCDRLVRALLPAPRVGEELVEHIRARSGGNPLFVREIVRELRQRSPVIGAPVPASLRGLVAAQLADEHENVRRVLALAACAEEPDVSLVELARAAELLDPPISDPELFAALDRALQTRTLEERESAYAFRQPLVRAALYEGLPRHRRDQLQAAHARSRGKGARRLRVAARA
jgi:predicted ATPase